MHVIRATADFRSQTLRPLPRVPLHHMSQPATRQIDLESADRAASDVGSRMLAALLVGEPVRNDLRSEMMTSYRHQGSNCQRSPLPSHGAASRCRSREGG